MGSKWNSWYLRGSLSLLGIFSLTALILSLVRIHNVTLPSKDKYGLVFDAGSSHTSLFVYQWPEEKENDTGVVSQMFSCHVKGPGISSYANNPPKAGTSLQDCLNAAMRVIPPERQQESPVYLGATAGMRLLRMQNESAAAQILEAVSQTIQKYPVSFQGARIISGKEEGAFGWITINYLLNSFTQYSAQERGWIRPPSANILGALDLGGASTQISFIPAGLIVDPSEAVQFRLYGFDYTIYSHSYLCYGQNQAFQRVIRLILNAGASDEVAHPCYPKGYQEMIRTASLSGNPCAKPLSSTASPANVTLVGKGNFSLCREQFKAIFNFSGCRDPSSCGFEGIYQPSVNGKFLAFSAYYYTFRFLNLTASSPLATVERAIQVFCARTWEDLSTSYPREKPFHLKNYCASASFIVTLLLDGYGFRNDTWQNIAFQMQAANSDIGWTLGYMLNLTNMIRAEAPPLLKGHQEAFWIASIFFLVAGLALCLLILVLQSLL
ncbi:ectonucleoside triphosphate diphosphohydrolase 8 [Ahaetulla prasina]|uniref:ectonucleoside triphosphate diphosphohydrolase 8 n=1 Tax=Ahaetulla prasina TaxID=499056 RepID=UPI0026488D8D|nr:ectonucleoside triphosphate diphosphohydrolase 8 [Ahaetulla prasina]XP_058015464.1 ectonucleoside triphosphate diphosphohydrolase 8 [Ahaetulla prasina]XP_058015465.1 ectonucleoside triphosphate diphosphohydrolase 8 [Ahaetulla prasina]